MFFVALELRLFAVVRVYVNNVSLCVASSLFVGHGCEATAAYRGHIHKRRVVYSRANYANVSTATCLCIAGAGDDVIVRCRPLLPRSLDGWRAPLIMI